MDGLHRAHLLGQVRFSSRTAAMDPGFLGSAIKILPLDRSWHVKVEAKTQIMGPTSWGDVDFLGRLRICLIMYFLLALAAD